MSIRFKIGGALLPLLVLTTGVCQAQKTPSENAAKTVITQLTKGDYEKPRASFDDAMKSRLSADKLRQGWESRTGSAGKLISVQSYQTTVQSGNEIVTAVCKFEKSLLDVLVVFNKEHKIAGLSLKPHTERRTTSPNEAAARAVVTQCTKGEFEKVRATFDATMTAKLPTDELSSTWGMVTSKAGAFQKQLNIVSDAGGGYDAVTVVCQFAKAKIDVKVVFDKDRKIAGLSFQNHQG